MAAAMSKSGTTSKSAASQSPPTPSKPSKNGRSGGPVGLRVLWTTLKIVTIPALCLAAVIFGMAVGYAVLGKQSFSDVFDWNTWKHMYDLVFSRT